MLKSRFRKKEKKGGFLPILIPVMNLFLLILPLVIQNAYLQKLTTLELQLPTLSEAAVTQGEPVKNLVLDIKESTLSVYIDDKLIDNIIISEGFENLLLSRLVQIKKDMPNKKDVLIKVSPQVKYELVIKVIDQCKKENKLFPEVVYFDEER